MRKEFVYSFMALGAIPVVVNAADVQVQATSVDLSVTAEDGSEVIKKEVGTLLKGSYTLTGKLTSRLYKVKIKIGGQEVELEPDPDNDVDVNIPFTLAAATNVTMEAVSVSKETGSKFTLGSMALKLSFDFDAAKTTLTNAANALTTSMAAYAYDNAADVTAQTAILTKITAIAETYAAYDAQKLYDLNNSPIMAEINALAETIADHQNTQAYNDVYDKITDIKAQYNNAKAAIEAELTGAAAYLMASATADLDAINASITAATQANYAAKEAGNAVAKKGENLNLLPTDGDITNLLTKYTGDTNLDTQAKKNKDAYAALMLRVTTLEANLAAVTYVDPSIAEPFAQERQAAATAIAGVRTTVEGAYNKAAQLTLDIDASETAAQGKITTLAGKVTTANDEFTANANTVAAIAVVQGKLNAAKTAVDAKVSVDGDYKAKDYYAAYVTAVQGEITALSTAAGAAYKVDGTGTAQTYNAALNTTSIENEITAYQTNAIAAVDYYDKLQTLMAGYQIKLDAARAIYAAKDYYDNEGAAYDFKFTLDKLQKDINDIQAAIVAAKAKVGDQHWTAMLAIDNRELFPKTFATVAELAGESFAIINAADGKAIYGTYNQNLGYNTFENSFKAANSGYTFKLEASAVNGAYRLRLQTPAGENYYYAPGWNSDGLCYLNSQPANGNVSFVASIQGQGEGKDIQNGAAWNIEYVADKGFTLKNVGTGKYLKDASAAKYDEPTYFTFKTVSANPENSIESKILAVVNRETNADNNWTADGLTGGSVKDLETKITAFKAKYTAETLGTEFNAYNTAETDIETALGTIKTNIANSDKSASATADLLAGYGKAVNDLAAQQVALEKAAEVIYNGVTANTTLKDKLVNATTGEVKKLNDKVTTFKTTYGIDPANASILDESFNDVSTAESTIKSELNAAETAVNDVTPTDVAVDDKTNTVGTGNDKWLVKDIRHDGAQPNITNQGGINLVEQWKSSSDQNCALTGTILAQTVTDLPNGVYTIELYAFAADQRGGSPTNGSTNVAVVYANDVTAPITVTTGGNNNSYTLKNVVVSNGTVELGLKKISGGTNWHGIQIKSLEAHTTIANATALATQETAIANLNTRQAKLETEAGAIKKAVAAVGTLSYNGLKNLPYVTDANGAYDNAAALKSLTLGTGAEDWYVFKTGLANDKTFEARLQKAQNDEAAMRTAIKTAFNSQAGFAAIWNDTDKSFTLNNKEYKVGALQDAIDAIKTDAGTEKANWDAYAATVTPYVTNVTNAITAALTADANDNGKTDLEDKAGAGALAHYQGVLNGYTTDKNTILNDMKNSLNNRKAVADKGDDNSGYVKQLKDLKAKADAVLGAADDNYKKYIEQRDGDLGYNKIQALWNETYTTIAATDQSTKRQDWLDELDAIQVTLTAATDAVDANYPVGESVAKAPDLAAIKASIEDVKARQTASYNEYIAADNLAAHQTFVTAIQLAENAYQDAVQARAKYSSTNAAIDAAVTAAAQTLDGILYDCPELIQNLKTAENNAYVAAVSPTVFDVSSYNTQATQIKQDIVNALAQFKTDVKTAIQNFWNGANYKPAYDAAVSAAETAIADYSTEAKTDAFKDVKDLIAKGNNGVNAMLISEVEEAIAGLDGKIDNMLAADKDAAAVKDLNPRFAEVETLYSTVKAYITGVTIVDDVNNVKATKLAELEAKYNDGNASNNDVAYAKTQAKTFANRGTIKAILDAFITTANGCKTAVETAVTNDVANTAAYNAMTAALAPVATKLTDAKAAAAPYKYSYSFSTDEGTLANLQTAAGNYKTTGQAVPNKAQFLADVATLDAAIDATLTAAFGNEKTQLAADITELKNQYNAYVAENGLNDTANGFKADIDDLEVQLGAIDIKDLNTPANGIQFNEIVTATEALIQLQNDIADKETELLAANANGANAATLADFTTQLDNLNAQATLEGKAPWVGAQKVNANDAKTIAELIAEISDQIATVRTAIEAEANISFYKKQYQDQITAIETALTPVVAAINAKQAQFDANAAAYPVLMAQIAELQGKIDAAKAKVGAYVYAKTTYITDIEQKNNQGVLTGGAQKTLNDAKAAIETANTSVTLTANSVVAGKAAIENAVQNYLDKSAFKELEDQRQNLYVLLANAIDIATHEGVNKYSSALWKRLTDEETIIDGEIDDLEYPIWNSYQTYKSTAINTWVYVNNQQVAKACTSDADYEAQIAIINTIKGEIADLSDAVDNLDLLGDANVDGKVNVLDYQKVLNMILDPALQPADDTDLFVNIDINQSTVIEVGDLTAIVNYILNHNWPYGYAAARGAEVEGESLAMTTNSLANGKQRIAVNLTNVSDYTAFQMDVVLPNGMTIVGAELSDRAGESHKFYTRNQMDGSVRMLASSVKGETFSGNEGAVLYIDVETTSEYMGGNVELLNILFSDVNAQTRSFAIGGDATGIDTMSTFEALKQKVYDLGGRVKNGLKKGINIIRRADGSTEKVVK